MRERAEEELRESEERYRALFEQANDSIVLIDPEAGKVVDFNDMACASLGYTREEFKELTIRDIEAIESPEEIAAHIKKIIAEGSDTFETKHTAKDGSTHDILVRARTITVLGKLYIQSMWHDITKRKETERKLKRAHDELEEHVNERTGELSKALLEKEVLLKEIHHRVKNNMQIISSMLSLQSGYIKDQRARDAFQESCERINSMSLVHEKLYQSRDLASIDFPEYIRDLTASLLSSYNINTAEVKLKTNVTCLSASFDTAIQYGLIINELVSNSLKYAFAKGQEGKVTVEATCNDEGSTLIVSDNGVGMPMGYEVKEADTLGIELVKILSRQSNGKIEVDSAPDKGTTFRINFPAGC